MRLTFFEIAPLDLVSLGISPLDSRKLLSAAFASALVLVLPLSYVSCGCGVASSSPRRRGCGSDAAGSLCVFSDCLEFATGLREGFRSLDGYGVETDLE